MEAAGIEPASESRSTTASTCVVYLLNLTRGRPGKRGCPHASSNKLSLTHPRTEVHEPARISRRSGRALWAKPGGTGCVLVTQPLRTYRPQL